MNVSHSTHPDYKKWALILILCISLFKCFFSFTLELGNDEAYYWVFGQYPEWNYFDHPPMVGVWIRIFTLNMLLDDYEGFVRMGSIVGSALASWFIFRTVTLIHSERTGWFVAVIYHASYYAGITAGTYILPDSPQMVFWTFSLWMIARLMNNDKSWLNWILFGLGAGLCIMSKVHGVFLWFGLGLYILTIHWRWLSKPQLYISFLITALIISPVLLWNIKYDFITYSFHSERVEVTTSTVNLKFFLKELLNQIFLNNPINVGLVFIGFILWKKKKLNRFRALTVYNFIGISLAASLLFVSIFRNTVLPHWSGPAYVALMPLAAVCLAEINVMPFPKVLRWSMLIFILGITGGWLIIQLYPGTYGSKDNKYMGRKDITLDMYGWTEGGKKFTEFYKEDVRNGRMPEGAPLVCSYWGGAHSEYYFGRPAGLTLICFGIPESIHQYLWINEDRQESVQLDSVYCIATTTKPLFIPVNYYKEMKLATIIPINRNGKPAHMFYIYRLTGLIKPMPLVKDYFPEEK